MKQKIEGGWRSRFDKKFNSGLNCPFCNAQNFTEDETEHTKGCDFVQIEFFISDLLASERQRCVEETEKVIWDKLSQPMASIVVGIIRDSQSIHN